MERFVRVTAPTGRFDFAVKLAVLVLISGFFNHLRDVITAGGQGYHTFWHNTMDASWTALPMCFCGLLLIGHLNNLQFKLYVQATTDALTRLPNRRWFMDHLARIDGAGHVIVMLDVDHFKRVNDLYGHDAGDLCLQRVASHLQDHLRPGDFCARLGGEEFAVLLRSPSEQAIRDVAMRMVGGVTLAPQDGQEVRVTLSAGVARLDDWHNIPAALRAADAALYSAKGNGRARFERADGPQLSVGPQDRGHGNGVARMARA